MIINCDICGKPAEPQQGLFGCPGDGGRSGPKRGDRRHYQCHVDTHGKPDGRGLTALFADLRRSVDDRQLREITGESIKVPNVKKGDYNRSENAARPFTMHSIISEMGRRRGSIDCPFCNTRFTAFVWSLAGGGKKCPNCGAKHASFGVAYPLIGNEDL